MLGLTRSSSPNCSACLARYLVRGRFAGTGRAPREACDARRDLGSARCQAQAQARLRCREACRGCRWRSLYPRCDGCNNLPMCLKGSRLRGCGRAGSTLWLGTVVALGFLLALVTGASGRPYSHGSAATAKACHAPHVTGLVLSVARARARKAGCHLRLLGATVERPEIQTIRRQTPKAGRRGRVVTVWVNPLCSGSALAGPPAGEPLVTPGPTELVSGLYLDGGPERSRSVSRCASLSGEPGPGTIAVTDPVTGATVATKTVASGHLATFPLPAGTYTISGTFGGATINGQPGRSFPQTVQIPPGKTVRQDVVLSVP